MGITYMAYQNNKYYCNVLHFWRARAIIQPTIYTLVYYYTIICSVFSCVGLLLRVCMFLSCAGFDASGPLSHLMFEHGQSYTWHQDKCAFISEPRRCVL